MNVTSDKQETLDTASKAAWERHKHPSIKYRHLPASMMLVGASTSEAPRQCWRGALMGRRTTHLHPSFVIPCLFHLLLRHVHSFISPLRAFRWSPAETLKTRKHASLRKSNKSSNVKVYGAPVWLISLFLPKRVIFLWVHTAKSLRTLFLTWRSDLLSFSTRRRDLWRNFPAVRGRRC